MTSERALHRGPVVVDLQGLQSPGGRGRGIGRFLVDWATALETLRPDLVGRYLLNPKLNPPGSLGALLSSGKVEYASASSLDRHRVFHVGSPFDTSRPIVELWPRAASDNGLALSAMVYDLIPALDLANELVNPFDRRAYRTRFEFLRFADQLHVLAESVRDDVVRLAGVAPDKITVIGAAANEVFRPPVAKDLARSAARRAIGTALRGEYVLYPSGHHPRKNNEGLVRAWTTLPSALRDRLQLVISGELPSSARHHLEVLAATHDCEGSVVMPGYVDEATLVALYQGAELVCFPSLSEGFGLPVVEALACATPVIVSDRPPLDRLADEEHRFDPTSPPAIAEAIVRALTTTPPTVSPEPSAPSWSDVARRSADAFEQLLSSTKPTTGRTNTPRTHRIAVVTPLPPAPTGVALYSYRLTEALRREGCEIDAFVEGDPNDALVPAGVGRFHAAALNEVERLRGSYDDVLYVIGNSHHHLGALALLTQRAGHVLSHDVRLTNLYRHRYGDPGLLLGGFEHALHTMYEGELPAGLGHDGLLSQEEIDHFGTFMARDVIRSSKSFFVSSQAAAELARLDAGASYATRVEVLPFAIASPSRSLDTFADAMASTTIGDPETSHERLDRTKPSDAPANPAVIGHFGIVDPAKAPEALIEALALAGGELSGVLLVFVGPIADDVLAFLRSCAQQHGISDRVRFAGPVDSSTYLAWLQRVTLAIQLRRSFSGEASAAIGDCLVSGVPTIVSNVGWCAELPEGVVHKIGHPLRLEELTRAIEAMVHDEARLERISQAARHYASEHDFSATARYLLERLSHIDSERSSRTATVG